MSPQRVDAEKLGSYLATRYSRGAKLETLFQEGLDLGHSPQALAATFQMAGVPLPAGVAPVIRSPMSTEDILNETLRQPKPTGDILKESLAPISSVSKIVDEVTGVGGTGLDIAALRRAPLRTTTESAVEVITEILLDQADPLNLAALFASFGGWGLAGRAVAPLATAAVTRFGTKLFAPATLNRVVRRAAQGLGGAIPFSVAEFIEEPERDTTRVGNFGRELLFFETFDLALITLGGGVNAARRTFGKLATQELREATGASLKAAFESIVDRGIATGDNARGLAMAAVLEAKVKDARSTLGPGVAETILASAEQISSAPAATYRKMLDEQTAALVSSPAVLESLRSQGIEPLALRRFFSLLRQDADDVIAQQIEQQAIRTAETETRAATRDITTAASTAASRQRAAAAIESLDDVARARVTDVRAGKIRTFQRMFAQGRRVVMNEDEIILALGLTKPELDALVANGTILFDSRSQMYSMRAAGIPEPPPLASSPAAKALADVMKKGARNVKKRGAKRGKKGAKP